MSDLANSCKYLTNERLCENEMEKASRQIRCRNVEKLTCCYLCMFVLDCAKPCQFEGNSDEPQQIDTKQTPAKDTVIREYQPEGDKTKSTPAVCCSSCSAEMIQTRTKFTIDQVKESPRKLANDNSKTWDKELPVIVYICLKCGKIDLRVEEKLYH